MPRRSEGGRLAWSSVPRGDEDERGTRTSPDAEKSHSPPGKQVVRLLRSRRGRAGKTVIIIEGLDLPPDEYRNLAHDLRQALGTGGVVKEQVMEIQGDIRDRVANFLAARGYRIKLVGG